MLGALDETDKEHPMVIIPNYVMARPNCLEATSLVIANMRLVVFGYFVS